MNRTIKEVSVDHYHYDCHSDLETYLHDFIRAYNFARRNEQPRPKGRGISNLAKPTALRTAYAASSGELNPKRLKPLKGLSAYKFLCKIGITDPDRFLLNPTHQMLGLNI